MQQQPCLLYYTLTQNKELTSQQKSKGTIEGDIADWLAQFMTIYLGIGPAHSELVPPTSVNNRDNTSRSAHKTI